MRLAERVEAELAGRVEGHDRCQRRVPQHGTARGGSWSDEAVLLRSPNIASFGGWIGAWFGLVLGVKLVHLSIRRRRTRIRTGPGRLRVVRPLFLVLPARKSTTGIDSGRFGGC